MNYLLRNNKRPKSKAWKFKIVLIILAFISLFFLARTDLFKRTLNKTALPFWSFEAYATGKSSGLFSIIKSKRSLILENRKLSEELKNTNADLLIQKELFRENEELKDLLGRSEFKENFILAAVLVKPDITPFDVIVIDIGEDKAVQKGDRVFYRGTVAIGEVWETYSSSAKVKMYSSPGEKFIAFVGQKSVQIEAEGLGGGNFMAKLPYEAEIGEGDAAIVPNISSSVFGFVERIDVDPVDSFKRIIFKNPVNLTELKWVEVERKSDKIGLTKTKCQ